MTVEERASHLEELLRVLTDDDCEGFTSAEVLCSVCSTVFVAVWEIDTEPDLDCPECGSTHVVYTAGIEGLE